MKKIFCILSAFLFVVFLTVPACAATSIYTGQQITDQLAAQRSIAVMFPTDAAAQPQYGIGSADILYEMMEEGGVSRQMGIIHNWTGLAKIGNIRSCRAYYTFASREWDSILVHFGGVAYMKFIMEAGDIQNVSGALSYGVGGGTPGSSAFYRTRDKAAPHNAYTSGANLLKAAQSLKYSLINRAQFYKSRHWAFGNSDIATRAGAIVADKVSLKNLFPSTSSAFTYSPQTGLYYKTLHGVAQKDGNTGQQLAFSNIIVQGATHTTLDKKGYIDIQMLGSGSGWFITKGLAIPITWSKADAYSPTVFKDQSGKEVIMTPGKTYIGVVKPGIAVGISQ